MENEWIYSDYSKYYPTENEIEEWIASIHSEAENSCVTVSFTANFNPAFMGCFHGGARLVKFTLKSGHEFWGNWIPKQTGSPAPLLVHVPGYGAELSDHPDVAAAGYNVLLLSPLGYWTPGGFRDDLREGKDWPVLPDTIVSGAKEGYHAWLRDCVAAIDWAMCQPSVQKGSVSFYGTSQGGGAALLLGSVYAGRGTRCVAADEPFLTDYPDSKYRGAYGLIKDPIEKCENKIKAWHDLGFADTVAHAYRMDYPVLLTAGGQDGTCPADTVEKLSSLLPATKSFTLLHDHSHGYNQRFIKLALAWFALYA